MFIELTDLTGNIINVNYERIDNIRENCQYKDDDFSETHFTLINQSNTCLRVKETPEEIMQKIKEAQQC